MRNHHKNLKIALALLGVYTLGNLGQAANLAKRDLSNSPMPSQAGNQPLEKAESAPSESSTDTLSLQSLSPSELPSSDATPSESAEANLQQAKQLVEDFYAKTTEIIKEEINKGEKIARLSALFNKFVAMNPIFESLIAASKEPFTPEQKAEFETLLSQLISVRLLSLSPMITKDKSLPLTISKVEGNENGEDVYGEIALATPVSLQWRIAQGKIQDVMINGKSEKNQWESSFKEKYKGSMPDFLKSLQQELVNHLKKDGDDSPKNPEDEKKKALESSPNTQDDPAVKANPET